MGTKIAIGVLSLCLIVAQLSPFTTLTLAVSMKLVDKKASLGSEQSPDISSGEVYIPVSSNNNFEDVPTISNPDIEQYDEDGNLITQERSNHMPNYTLELDGYGTFDINTSDLYVLSDESTSTKKALRYSVDNRSKLTFGYITDLLSQTDVPGYITRKTASVDTLTNDKYEVTIDDKVWMCVPSQSKINDLNVRVYYLLSEDKNSAFYVRADIYPSTDDDDFKQMLTEIFKTVNVYYIGKTVFDTPTEGYYIENPGDDNVAHQQEEYQENDSDHNVFQSENGFIESDLPDNWEDLTFKLGENTLSVPCHLSDILDKGYRLSDSLAYSADSIISAGADFDIIVTNDSGVNLRLVVNNDSLTDMKQLMDCAVKKITVDLNDFQLNQELPENYFLIAGGMTTSIYTDDIIKYFGNPQSERTVQSGTVLLRELTYSSGNKKCIISSGIVSGIQKVEFIYE